MTLEVFLVDHGQSKEQARSIPMKVDGKWALPPRIMVKKGQTSKEISPEHGCKTIITKEILYELGDHPHEGKPIYFQCKE